MDRRDRMMERIARRCPPGEHLRTEVLIEVFAMELDAIEGRIGQWAKTDGMPREVLSAICGRQDDDIGKHRVGTPIQQIHSDRLALLNETLRVRGLVVPEVQRGRIVALMRAAFEEGSAMGPDASRDHFALWVEEAFPELGIPEGGE